MTKQDENLLAEYRMLVTMCDIEIESESTTENLRIYIKGKKEAYERIVTDLEKRENQ